MKIKNILALLLLVGFFLTLGLLSTCQPPAAYAITFKPSFDSTFIPSPGGRELEGVWVHPIGDTAVISWELDSVYVPYAEIETYILDIPEGKYQFHIYPKNADPSSPFLLWESWAVWDIRENRTIEFAAGTDYFLVNLDTTNTWGFNTGHKSQGYQYLYYRADTLTNYWPSYTMDYYCGTPGQDSTYFEFHLDSARSGTMYPIRCFVTYGAQIKVNLLGAIDSVQWTLVYKP